MIRGVSGLSVDYFTVPDHDHDDDDHYDDHDDDDFDDDVDDDNLRHLNGVKADYGAKDLTFPNSVQSQHTTAGIY